MYGRGVHNRVEAGTRPVSHHAAGWLVSRRTTRAARTCGSVRKREFRSHRLAMTGPHGTHWRHLVMLLRHQVLAMSYWVMIRADIRVLCRERAIDPGEVPSPSCCERPGPAADCELREHPCQAPVKDCAGQIEHLVTHLPSNPHCEACLRGKMQQVRHFHGAFARPLSKLGHIVTLGHIVAIDGGSQSQDNRGQ